MIQKLLPNSTFTVQIENSKMEFNVIPTMLYLPKWIPTIINERNLVLDNKYNLSDIHDFFDGLQNDDIKINKENCHTFLKLGKECESEKIVKIALNIIDDIENKPINKKFEEFIESGKNNKFDQHYEEERFSKHYNELLLLAPDSLKNTDISQHLRIVKSALEYYGKEKFNYRRFISFVLDSLESTKDRKYSILFKILELNDFDDKEIERLSKCQNFDENLAEFKLINYCSKITKNMMKKYLIKKK